MSPAAWNKVAVACLLLAAPVGFFAFRRPGNRRKPLPTATTRYLWTLNFLFPGAAPHWSFAGPFISAAFVFAGTVLLAPLVNRPGMHFRSFYQPSLLETMIAPRIAARDYGACHLTPTDRATVSFSIIFLVACPLANAAWIGILGRFGWGRDPCGPFAGRGKGYFFHALADVGQMGFAEMPLHLLHTL